MKKMIFIALFLLMCFLSPISESNAYMQTAQYDMITVRSGDNLWLIAGRYVTEKDDVRDMIAAIHKVNALDRNAEIMPGQQLKIPLTQK